jgi:hypothetical protein
MFMKKLFYIFALVAFTLTSCEKNEIVSNLDGENSITSEGGKRSIRPVILGEQKKNPFSLENMKIALDTLKKMVSESDQTAFKAKAVDEIELETTDLYVRFLPQDSAQYKQLMNDTTLTLFDFPLDYEITQSGDYYQDPTLKKPFTWYYTTVKPGYIPHIGIRYEVLENLFIPEHSEYYSEELISEPENARQSSRKKISTETIDTNIFNALYVISFKLTGNEKELKQDTSKVYTSSENRSSIMKITVPNCTRYTVRIGFVKVSWTSCDPYYYPDGYIKFNTPNGEIGVKGIKVRMWRWFTYSDARTISNGYYLSRTKFNSIWVGNDIDYHIIFDGFNNGGRIDINSNGEVVEGSSVSVSWTLSRSLFGALCLWTNYYGAGNHHPSGYSMTFDTDNDYWGKCVLNNAIYDYCDYAIKDGISLPPNNLDIANKKSDDLTSSAPLLNNHINWSLVYAYPNFWGVIGQIYAYDLFGSAYPDLILRYKNDKTYYNAITSIVWHELTHASQVKRMINEKGILWASDYWSANVYQQANNTLETDSAYRHKGAERWQQIALSEGWANYREWYLGKNYLAWNTISNQSWASAPYSHRNYTDKSLGFPVYYAKMYESLVNIGCSFSDIEKSLCTYSVNDFKEKMKTKYPSKSSNIDLIVTPYE